jgi:hypothetical protein
MSVSSPFIASPITIITYATVTTIIPASYVVIAIASAIIITITVTILDAINIDFFSIMIISSAYSDDRLQLPRYHIIGVNLLIIATTVFVGMTFIISSLLFTSLLLSSLSPISSLTSL